jgi:hypothetical protein
MKRVLILAYDFPPYVSVGGLRPYSWYKHFYEFGIYPIVVTRQWGNKYGNHLDYIAPGESNETIVEETETGTIIRTPYQPNWANRLMLKYGESNYRLLRKTITAWYEMMQFLFFVGPKVGLYKGAKAYLETHKVDALIATGEPFVLFKYAAKLSQQQAVPWIADYRDPWTQSTARSRSWFMRRWNAFFEKRFLSGVDHITTVSGFFQGQIATLIRDKSFSIISNGYDEDVFVDLKERPEKSEVLKLAFVGSLYDWHPWRSVLTVIRGFLMEHNDCQIHIAFFGVNKPLEIAHFLKQYPMLESNVKIVSSMPNHQLISELSQYHVLLLFNYYNFVGTKIYDYLALKRPILFCYTNDKDALALKAKYYPFPPNNQMSDTLQESIIRETRSGYLVKDAEQLAGLLPTLYKDFKEKGYLPCDSIHIERFSRKNQTQKLAELIKTLVLNH